RVVVAVADAARQRDVGEHPEPGRERGAGSETVRDTNREPEPTRLAGERPRQRQALECGATREHAALEAERVGADASADLPEVAAHRHAAELDVAIGGARREEARRELRCDRDLARHAREARPRVGGLDREGEAAGARRGAGYRPVG